MTTAGSTAEEIMEIVDADAHVYHSDEESYPPRPDAKRPPKVTGSLAHLKQAMTETRVTRVFVVQSRLAHLIDRMPFEVRPTHEMLTTRSRIRY